MKYRFFTLLFIASSAFGELYLNEQYDLIVKEAGEIVGKYPIFEEVKQQMAKGERSADSVYIVLEKEQQHYNLITDLYSAKYYETFKIIDAGNNHFSIKQIQTDSVNKTDFNAKTITCTAEVNIPLENFKHNMLGGNQKNCEVSYPLERTLSEFESYVVSIYQDKIALREIDSGRINAYLSRIPLTKETVNAYNNIAFYLIEGGQLEPAIALLEKITKAFNHRAVAYINLADGYWAMGQKEKALKNYSRYVLIMRQNGKENKIPARVLAILNE